jgi:hypothetical protein
LRISIINNTITTAQYDHGIWYNNGGAPTLTLGYLADQYYLDDNNYAAKVGKEKSGCLLDGIEYKELPS